MQAGVQSGPGNIFSYGADGGLINSTRLAAISCAAVLFTKFASNGGGEVRAGVYGAVGGLIDLKAITVALTKQAARTRVSVKPDVSESQANVQRLAHAMTQTTMDRRIHRRAWAATKLNP